MSRAIQPRSYDGRIQEMLDAAGVTRIEPKIEGKKGYRKEVSRTTGFRKLVNTTMVRCKVDPLIKEMLLGHHTGLEENYYRPEEQELLQQYLKCIDDLTVNSEYRLKMTITSLVTKQDEERTRLEKALEERERLTHATVNQFSEQLLKMQRRIEELERQKETQSSIKVLRSAYAEPF